MGNTIKFNSSAFRTILTGAGTRAAVNGAAGRIHAAAGFGPRVSTIIGGYGGGRVVAFVTTKARTPEEAEKQRERLESAVMGG